MTNLKLGVKIGIGFAVILILTVVVGYSGFSALKNVIKETDFYSHIDEIKNSFTLAAAQCDRYLLYNYSEGRENQTDSLQKFNTYIDACTKQISDIEKGEEVVLDVQESVKKIRSGITAFREDFVSITEKESEKIKDSEALFNIFTTIEQKAQWFDTVKSGATLMKADCEGYFQRHTDAKWNMILEHLKTFDKAVKSWEEQVGNNKMMNKMFLPVKDLYKQIPPLLEKYQESVKLQQSIIEKLYESKAEVNKSLLTARDLSFKNMNSERHRSNIVILVSVLIALLTGIIYGLMTTRAIVKPIRSIVVGMYDIAEGDGDLTKRLEVTGKDEVGELASNFNRFIEKIHALIQDISKNSKDLDSASGELRSIAEKMSTDSMETTSKASTVAGSSQDLSSNMNSVAAAMEQASANINTVSAAAEQMTATINEIAKSSENAREMTGNAVSEATIASKHVDELKGASESIGKVVETIAEISDMVNLLALNATIEAARAGEAGKGFAVVANEIKELARQTTEASDEIKNRMGGIRTTTDTTMGHITTIGEMVNSINEMITIIAGSAEEQSATTTEIAGNVSQVSVGISEVNRNVAQSSRGVSEISSEIVMITSASDQISGNSSRVHDRAADLAEMAKELKSVVGKFRI